MDSNEVRPFTSSASLLFAVNGCIDKSQSPSIFEIMDSPEHKASEYFARMGLSLTSHEESKGRRSWTLKTKDDHVEAYNSSLDELWRDWKRYGLRILQGANQMSKLMQCYDSSNESGKRELRNAIKDYYQRPLFHSSMTRDLLSPIIDARQFCTVDDLPDDLERSCG